MITQAQNMSIICFIFQYLTQFFIWDSYQYGLFLVDEQPVIVI